MYMVIFCGGKALNINSFPYSGYISGFTVINRLAESIGQANHVLLNMATTYNGRLLATQIKRYFELNPQVSEAQIFKGGQAISIKRGYALSKLFVLSFSRKYGK